LIDHHADVEDTKITLRKIRLKAQMAEMGCTERDLEDRKAAAVQALDEWITVTGVLTSGDTYHWELKSIVEDAVEIGMLGETLEEPDVCDSP
jgi:hypothetical protein